MLEGDRVVDLAYQRLAGDSTLLGLVNSNVVRAPALPGQAYPFLTVGRQADTPTNTLSGARVLTNVVLRVVWWVTTATGQGQPLQRQIGDRVDTLLQTYGGTTGGVYVVKFRLEGVVDQDEAIGSSVYLQRVALYRTEAHAA